MARVNAETARCPWTGNDALYTRYHDEEWGVPHCDSDRLFEKLILEGFQSGLSWITILRKRENFRKAFDDFDAEKIARYGARDVRRLMMDEGIVRNRLKIEAAIDNARAYLALSERQPLSRFIWDLLDSKPRINAFRSMSQIPSQTVDSERISKALKKGGFRFVGPTTVYAFMQSSGMVNDHLVSCPRHEACAKLQRRFKL